MQAVEFTRPEHKLFVRHFTLLDIPNHVMADQNNPGQFGNRSDTEEQASKGGKSQGKESNPGNFANDREKAAEAGRRGGQARGGKREDMEDKE